MNKSQLPGYAVALAVLVVGLAAVGVPAGTLIFVPLLLACPLMMMFMMRGMSHGAPTNSKSEARASAPESLEAVADPGPAVDTERG